MVVETEKTSVVEFFREYFASGREAIGSSIIFVHYGKIVRSDKYPGPSHGASKSVCYTEVHVPAKEKAPVGTPPYEAALVYG